MTHRIAPLALVLAAAGLGLPAGCATPTTSANTVSRSESGRVHRVEMGEVVFVREVTIEGESRGGGAIAGGLMGRAVGRTIGGGRGNELARTAGTVGGAAAGAAAERAATTIPGLEITVELASGEMIVVIQGADEAFDEGDVVRVVRRADGQVRVTQ